MTTRAKLKQALDLAGFHEPNRFVDHDAEGPVHFYHAEGTYYFDHGWGIITVRLDLDSDLPDQARVHLYKITEAQTITLP